jgi:hypothetical protein
MTNAQIEAPSAGFMRRWIVFTSDPKLTDGLEAHATYRGNSGHDSMASFDLSGFSFRISLDIRDSDSEFHLPGWSFSHCSSAELRRR